MCHMCHKGAARLVAATTGLAKGTLASDLSAQLDSGAADRHAACAQNCSSIPSAFTLARSLGYALPWPENWAGRTEPGCANRDSRFQFRCQATCSNAGSRCQSQPGGPCSPPVSPPSQHVARRRSSLNAHRTAKSMSRPLPKKADSDSLTPRDFCPWPKAGTVLTGMSSPRLGASHAMQKKLNEEATEREAPMMSDHESFRCSKARPLEPCACIVVRNLSVFFLASYRQPGTISFCQTMGQSGPFTLLAISRKTHVGLWPLLPCTVQGQPKLHATVRVAFQLFDVDAWVA